MQKYEYRVSFCYCEGQYRGNRLVPKGENLMRKTLTFEAYHDTQVPVIISELIKAKEPVDYVYVVDIDILKKKEID